MALQVWLPLIKDTNSLGLSTVSGSLTNSSISYADGKLGKSIRIANYQTTTATYAGITNVEKWSICVWLKINSSDSFTNYQDFFIVGMNNNGTTGGGFRIEHTSVAGAMQIPVPKTAGLTDQNSWYTFYSNATCSKDQWAHIAVVNDGTNYYTYINGALASTVPISRFTTTSSKLTGTITLGMSGSYCYMNDLRIYDHPLSLDEVREISKGLALHWACNNNGCANANMLKYTNVTSANQTLLKNNVSGNWNNLTLTTKDGFACYYHPSDQSSTWFCSGHWYKGLKANTTYTYSAWIYFTTQQNFNFTSLGHFQVQNDNSTAGDKTHEDVVASRIYEPSVIPANTWTKIRITFTTNNLANSNFQIYPRYNLAAGSGELYIRGFKLEEGGTPTPWCPNSADTEYSSFGYNSTVERDLSGLQRDGTLVSAFPTVEAGAPRYSCSYKYTGNVNNAHYNTTTELNYTDNFSWSIWVKTNYTGSTAQYVFTVGRADAGGYGYGLSNTSTTACTVRFGNASWGVNVTGGEWTHIGFTKSGTTIKIYKNGNLYSTNTFSGTLPTYSDGNGVGIGCFHYSGNIYPYYGNISDFRIYATALSDDDMKRLYSTAASISNTGVMMAYEFIEE